MEARPLPDARAHGAAGLAPAPAGGREADRRPGADRGLAEGPPAAREDHAPRARRDREAIETARAAPLEVTLPLLFLLAPEDAVTDAQAALAWAAETGADVSVLELPGARHEILNDVDRGIVYERICDWCDARTG